MSKITVVGMAPYSVSNPEGSITPGAIRKVERTQRIDQQIADGILAEVAVKVEEEPTVPVRKPRSDPDSTKETS